MFTNQLSWEEKPRFEVLANFHGVSTPTMADFKLPIWLQPAPKNVIISVGQPNSGWGLESGPSEYK